MKKVLMAAMGGTLAGVVATTQFVGPLIAPLLGASGPQSPLVGWSLSGLF